jgi:hypothetical protein
MSFEAMTHLAKGLFLRALSTLKVDNAHICLAGTLMLIVSMIEWQLILPLKTLIYKASKCRLE